MEEIGAAMIADLERDDSLPNNLTLEQLVTDPRLAGFPASPVQRSLLRMADGLPCDDLIPDKAKRLFHFGTLEAPARAPRIVIVRTGVRSGKTLIAAIAGLVGGALRCTFRRPPDPNEPDEIPDPRDGLVGVRPGELVRAPIVTPLVKQSRAAFHHFIANMKASPVLSQYLVKALGEQAVIRRPQDGCEVLVEMIAASPHGDNLRSTWLAGVVFDESDFFDDEDAEVNLDENFDAAVSRLLPNAQAWLPSSPWADEGSYHTKFVASFGQPSDTLAFHSDTRSMNPTLSRQLEQDERARDPDKAAREYDAIPLSANSTQFFPQELIEKAINRTRKTNADGNYWLPPLPGVPHYAGSDFGFTKNSSACGISRFEDIKVRLAYYEETRPEKGKQLKPSEVIHGQADRCVEYGARSLRGDIIYSATAHEELGKRTRQQGLVAYEDFVPTTDSNTDACMKFKQLAQSDMLDLPPDPRLIQQLKGVRSKPVPGGRIRVQMPKQGNAHGDLLMSIIHSAVQVPIGEPKSGVIPVADYQRMLAANGGRWSGGGRGYG